MEVVSLLVLYTELVSKLEGVLEGVKEIWLDVRATSPDYYSEKHS